MAKTTKVKVHYQDMPNGADQCSKCTMYLGARECSAVAGDIAPSGWCELFKPRKKAAA